jgi:hypothetical protein
MNGTFSILNGGAVTGVDENIAIGDGHLTVHAMRVADSYDAHYFEALII